MAWNRSSSGAEADVKQERKPSRRKWCVALTVLVIGGIAALFLVAERDEGKKTSPKAVAARKAPALVPNLATNVARKAEEPKEQKEPELKPGERRRVVWKRPPNWDELSPAEKTRIQPVARVIKPKGWGKKSPFTEISDKRIARLLSIKPGSIVLGTPRYDEQFVKSFLESIKTPIIVSKDDTPEDAEIKKAVKAARLELKDAYDRGEDIGKLMEDTERQIKELGTYKENIRNELMSLRKKDSTTKQDMEDFVKAANMMLESRGIEPIKMGAILYGKAGLERINNADNAKQEEVR